MIGFSLMSGGEELLSYNSDKLKGRIDSIGDKTTGLIIDGSEKIIVKRIPDESKDYRLYYISDEEEHFVKIKSEILCRRLVKILSSHSEITNDIIDEGKILENLDLIDEKSLWRIIANMVHENSDLENLMQGLMLEIKLDEFYNDPNVIFLPKVNNIIVHAIIPEDERKQLINSLYDNAKKILCKRYCGMYFGSILNDFQAP